MHIALCGIGMTLILLLSSCNSKKYLEDHQSFLMANKIKIKSDYPIHSKSELSESLLGNFRQEQTNYSLGFPRHVFYYNYQNSLAKNPGRAKWDQEKVIKNRPVIFDSLKALQTTEDFTKYLALRGYRSAFVNYEAKTSNKKTKVIYNVNPGPRLIIDTALLITTDTSFEEILLVAPEPSFLVPGAPLDIQLYNQERLRIVRLLQNEGYATFDETFVSPLEVDTSGNRVKVTMRLLNPSDSTYHQKYRVGQVTIFPDYVNVNPPLYHDTTVFGIKYFLPDTTVFTLKPDVLNRYMYLRPGHINRREDLDHTLKNIGRIELIKFISPTAVIDTTHETPEIDYIFYLTRNKKINFDINGELTYSNIASEQRRSLFGTSFSSSYRDRNIFGNAEVLDLNMQLGFEFNFFRKSDPDYDALLNSLNAGLGGDLSFRRFMDPLKIYTMIGRSKNPDRKPLFGARLHQWLVEDATSRLSAGFNFVYITELYEYYNINANLIYDIQPTTFNKLTITRVGFDLFVPTAKPAYQEILDNNKFLAESFGNQLFTGFLFRNYLYEVNSKVKSTAGHFKLLHSVELSGIEMYAINRLVNVINKNDKAIVLNPSGDPEDQVEFSQFAKGEIDVRYFKDLTRNTSLAFKLNPGIASAYGRYTDQVPYPKQFFVGGALSNRAWQIRQLGPGGYEDTTAINPNLPFYQTGDFKIDFSAEMRFKLFWLFDGVIFLDAANVWIVQDDDTRPGATLSHNFYKEFGIGYGYGIRLDLDFFILRLDLGYKLHNPYPVVYAPDKPPSRWLYNELKKFPGGAEPQIAVGLPF